MLAFPFSFALSSLKLQADSPGEVPFDKFEEAVFAFVAGKVYTPPDQDLLLAAFTLLDPARTGSVSVEALREFLGGPPDGLSSEMDDFIDYAMAEGLISDE
ncbi:hypothetical protein BESB_048040 [Besnoitia besnoiti]|uniref:EF-hand domain-containing protein n=1 Tax=Besnoitia besnoiti TaxID=94643 RepID=A0A2A9MM72_BESBE|nr:hypothetical protein BESB_048040 [Besnoitia besnoiti]PFH36612.1 hypothetical protein BESB_048040 [Besnoitia besnoiti]